MRFVGRIKLRFYGRCRSAPEAPPVPQMSDPDDMVPIEMSSASDDTKVSIVIRHILSVRTSSSRCRNLESLYNATTPHGVCMF